MNNKKNKKFDFSNNFENIFQSTDPEDKLKGSSVINIAIEKLVPFKNHPFKAYEGERLADMIDSIKANGIIMPVIVRPLENELYEILSGHNRIKAAETAGLQTVPAVVRNDLSYDEALLIVTETNLIQRSFADLSHSERAAALAVHHEAIKNQGKRTDLINEIENLLQNSVNLSNNVDSETYAPLAHKSTARDKIGNRYDLSKDTVARYLRVNRLIDKLKIRLDNDEYAIRAAVDISYLSDEEQESLNDTLANSEYKLDMKKAMQLREMSKADKLSLQSIEDILSGVVVKKKNRGSLPVQSLKIGGKKLSKYFNSEQKPEEIEAELFEALEFFREHKKLNNN